MPLIRGRHYVVRESVTAKFHEIGESAAVRLEENVRIGVKSRGTPDPDFPWAAGRFRLAESSHSEAGSVRAKEPVSA